MKNIKALYLIILVVTLFSCQKVLQIDAASLTPKIVVDGTINTGENPRIILRRSGFLYDTIDIEDTYIHDAIVEISDGTETHQLSEVCFKLYSKIDSVLANNDTLGLQGLLFQLINKTEEEMDSIYYNYYGIELDDLEQSQLICAYGSLTLVGEELKTYTLTVTDKEETVTAVTTIPERFEIDSLSTKLNPEDNNFSEVFIHLTFPKDNVLGHFIQYGSSTEETQDFYGMRTGSVYSDATFEGSASLKLPLEGRKYGNEGRPTSAERHFKSGEKVTMIWKNIDIDTYEYILTSESDGGASPFSSPVKIISNIEGGLGNFSGFNVSTKTIVIP